ncbi:protein dead ringer-like [Arctopsyche grandis]|uniref:protein dead ringer-like n=1 Tax=Arctopsyche grandis TaxID=121162 RepID=UPI00406D7CF7
MEGAGGPVHDRDRDSDLEHSPLSHHDEGEGEVTDGEPEHDAEEDSSDECRGANARRDLLDRLRLHRPDKGRDDFESLKNSLHPHLSSLASLAQNTPLGSLPAAGGNPLLGPPNAPFSLPMGFPFQHPGSFLAPPQPSAGPNGPMNGPLNGPLNGTPAAQGGSASSSSSEGSTSSQQTWSFEEQFKQVRQLYEINDDPKRKEFLDDLFSFMQKRGTPINRLPIMAKSVLDLFELYNLVIARGGLVDVINKKLWQEIIKGLHLPSSITSAAFTLRTQYMKYLYPYECEKKNLSTPSELQAAIDGNRREGRRSSYGQYDSVQRSPVPTSMQQLSQQMSPLSLVTGGARGLSGGLGGGLGGGLALGNSLGMHHAAAQQAAHHGAHAMAHDLEQKMMEYMKLFQQKDFRRPGSESPPGTVSPRDAALSALEMSRLTLWSLYNNNASPPASLNNASSPINEPQREALNLSESPVQAAPVTGVCIKRELPEREPPPPAKRATPLPPSAHSPTPPPAPPALIPAHLSHHHSNGHGAAFKITSRGDARTGDQQLVVSMELNGVTYEGVLFANPQNDTSSPPSQRHRPMVS